MEPQAAPDVPGAQSTGIVVAGKRALAISEPVASAAVAHLGKAIRASAPDLGEWRIDVGFVIEALETPAAEYAFPFAGLGDESDGKERIQHLIECL